MESKAVALTDVDNRKVVTRVEESVGKERWAKVSKHKVTVRQENMF